MATPKKFDPKNIKIAKVVSLPTLSLKPGAPVYVQFEEPIKERVINEGTDKERTFQYAPVTDHVTGELMNLSIDNGILWALQGGYKGTDYVGKSFEITMFREKGQRFPKFSVKEFTL